MKMYKYKRIAVKIGSNVLTTSNGMLDTERMRQLVEQVSKLHKNGVEIILISSGAVASGRSEIMPRKKLDSVEIRQLFSAIGQVKLINNYYELFLNNGIVCGQVLTTKENFGTRRHYLNQKQCMEVMLENGVIPIVNENDTISVTELMFTDNDELSGLIATMMDVEALIILSNIDGIFDGDPSLPTTSLIYEVASNQNIGQYIQTSKSSFGRGGMLTKCKIARQVAREGIPVYIANGKTNEILIKILDGTTSVYTKFLSEEKETSSVKKWIAHSRDFAKGSIMINQGAKNALLSNEAHSLLPVGVVQVNGEFQRHDIVTIVDESNSPIGVGKVEFDHEKARLLAGKSHQKPLIHYDYLCLF